MGIKTIKSQKKDIEKIYSIIKSGIEYQQNQGINQWSNSSPWLEIIKNDIEKENSYLMIDSKNNNIVGIFTLIRGVDPTYINIYKGAWKYNEEYIAIHRVAISNDLRGKGISRVLFSNIDELCKQMNVNNIRIDTHEDNVMMKKSILKAGFEYAGIIYLLDGTKRLAYEKFLIKE